MTERKQAIAAAMALEFQRDDDLWTMIRTYERGWCEYNSGRGCRDPLGRASRYNYERSYCRAALKRPDEPYQLSMFKFCSGIRRLAGLFFADPEEVRLILLGRKILNLAWKE